MTLLLKKLKMIDIYIYQVSRALNISKRQVFHFSLELWYYTALVLITGYLKNSEVAIDALTIW